MLMQSNLWQKVRADLLADKARTALSIKSLTIGFFVIGTLLGMMDLQQAYMDNAHKQSHPSHISLIFRQDADAALAEGINNMTDVAGVDVLTQFAVSYKTPGANQWQTGTVLFRPDYQQQHYDIMSLRSGSYPTGQAVAAERLTAQFAGLSLGDSIEFATANGGQHLNLQGIIRHPFVKPPAFGGQLYFFIAPELAPLFGIPAHTFRQMLVQIKPPYSADKARKIAEEIRGKMAAKGIATNVTLLQDPDRHWGWPIFSGINMVLRVMAWASLALSAVLVLNTLAALITQQTDQIGIMKSLGASRWAIAKIYLTEVLILSLVALCIGIPLSCLGAFYSSRWLLDLFNIELPDFAYSPRTLGVLVIGGLSAPLLAALWPIWKGAAMPVRQALASYGLGGDFASQAFDRWLERAIASHLPTLYAVALGNLMRRKARLFWTQSVLIIAGVLFIVIMSLIASVNLTLDHELARSRYAVRLGFSQDQAADTVSPIAKSLPATTAIEFWGRTPAELFQNGQLIKQSGSLGIQMIALPADTTLYQPMITEGRWFDRGDEQQNHLVLNAATAELNGLKVGDSLSVKLMQHPASNWQVIGLYRSFAGAGYAVEAVYAPLSTVQQDSPNPNRHAFALLSADITNLEQEQAYKEALTSAFQQQHIKLDFYTTLAKLEQQQFAQHQFSPMTGMLLGLAIMIATVGGIGLSGTMALSVLQRTREICVLRAIGARSSAIFKLFMLEGLCHALLAWLLSVPLAYLLAEPLAKQLGLITLNIQLDFAFSWLAVGLWFVLIALLALVATYLPARNATRIAVREGLSY